MKQPILLLLLVILTITSVAQGIYNDNARIVSDAGSYWVIGSGGFTLTSQNATHPDTMANLTINNGASLIIAAGTFLTVSNTLTNNGPGGVVIQSDATGTGSLIANSVAGTGTTSAHQYMTGNPAWHQTSSPVTGQSVSNFLTANTSIATNGANRAMMDYNESINLWNPYYTTGTGNITAGKGFCMLTTTSDSVIFTGTLNASTYTVATTKTGNYGWNSIGNPYSSAIKINSAADITNNFITINSTKLDASYNSIYVWDETVSSTHYQIINHASTATNLSSGQAFFVKTATNGNTVTFTPDMQIHQSAMMLKSAATPYPEIKLVVQNNNKSVTTTIKYIDGTTKGLDIGYDAGMLKSDPSLALYTFLVEDNGVEFALQCLPDNNYKNMIIPVGLDSKTGGEVVFSSVNLNLSSECKVILEDKITATFTDLSTNSYKTIVAPNSVITDRFRLYNSTPVISGVGDLQTEGKLYAIAIRNTEIRITGEVTQGAVAMLYSTQGKQLLNKTLQAGNLNIIPISGLANGMYLLSVREKGITQGFKLMIRE